MSIENLKQLYCSLIRSILEYSAFLLPILSNKLIDVLKVIQNNALRIILKVKLTDKIKIDELHNLTKVEPIEIRLENQRQQYFTRQ